MSREIVLDTETTGLKPEQGDRLVEVGALELVNLLPTGRVWHHYINPERSMPEEAFRVHGLGDDFLADKPVWSALADDFLDFIGDAPLVIHNAPFDMGFLNMELRRLGRTALPAERAIDTLTMARRAFPGAQTTLDALCRRFGVDNTGRVLHGALLDAELLADVYLELKGGREPGLVIGERRQSNAAVSKSAETGAVVRTPLRRTPNADEAEVHAALVAKLKAPLWEKT